MKKKLLLTASIFFILHLANGPSYGWNDTGHMTVAFITYSNLTPTAKKRVDDLIRLNPKFNEWVALIPSGTDEAKKNGMLFMLAATWADQIKSDNQHLADGPQQGDQPPNDGTADKITGYSDRAMHKYWHFVDIPFSPDQTPLKSPWSPNASTQIPALRAILSSAKSDELKSYALVWLLHLVGDVHQPLHCASRFTKLLPNGDAGGNFVTICDPQCGRRLHAFWDGILGTSAKPMDSIKEATKMGLTPPFVIAFVANNTNSGTWISESFAAAKTAAYRTPVGIGAGPFPISADYRSNAQSLAMQRITLAGKRLAHILNNELK